MAPDRLYARAVAVIVLSGVFLSTAGVGIRLLQEAGGLQIIFYRGIGTAAFFAAYLALRDRRHFATRLVGIGWNGLLAAVFYAGASVSIVFAILNTTVANAMFIISLTPFIAALVGWVVLGERVSLRTWMAIALASVGVFIMVEGGLSGEGYVGIMFALCMALCYASFAVTLRRGRGGDMMPAACWAGAIIAVSSFVLADDLAIPPGDVLICLALGAFQVGLGTLLLVLGSRHVPAAQITFLAMLEVVLSPVWVWLAVGERPAAATLIGGGVIMAAIAWQALGAMSTQPIEGRAG